MGGDFTALGGRERQSVAAFGPAPAGLSLTKAVNNPAPQPGDEIIYSLRVSNNGTTSITGAVISDTLPAGLSLAGPISLDPPGAGIPGDAGTLLLLAHQLSLEPNTALTVTYPVLN